MSNELNRDSFHVVFIRLFGHADDPAAAYEQLRDELIILFEYRGHSSAAEDLADEVIVRMFSKAHAGSMRSEGAMGVHNFALGIARNVHREYLRKIKREQPGLPEGLEAWERSESFETESESFEAERNAEALEICLDRLKSNERKLLTEYYGERHGETKRLAFELGISHGQLRVQVLRLKRRLRTMMVEILNN